MAAAAGSLAIWLGVSVPYTDRKTHMSGQYWTILLCLILSKIAPESDPVLTHRMSQSHFNLTDTNLSFLLRLAQPWIIPSRATEAKTLQWHCHKGSAKQYTGDSKCKMKENGSQKVFPRGRRTVSWLNQRLQWVSDSFWTQAQECLVSSPKSSCSPSSQHLLAWHSKSSRDKADTVTGPRSLPLCCLF
jgi:hypothetical protein